ncbi:acyl transferase domain-containing protein [Tumebacillus sp. BK434]|uniref:type I polyketide synthase n=1 Tax=Tumebacillus sp. BK434 TaxID=2512169 RepID=UPI0010D47EDD|nr:type I polyketide synthase [Tumebacillus sp. BK434]TCP59152.1 acyl transferase domain-containing protein [Tumebacillus sp. BK434]
MYEEETLDGIAIVGMAGRFPGAADIGQFWQNLRDGVESVSWLSEEELLRAGRDPELVTDPQYVKAAAMLDGVDLFDAAFFGYNPREAETIDPQQRLFLETAWTALEHAGYQAEAYDGLISVFAGAGMNRYLLYNLAPNRALVKALGEAQMMIGNDKDFLATRTAYKLNLKGAAVGVQTACSSSLVAVHMACQSLLSRECDMALAGGVTIAVPQENGYLYHEGGIASDDGHTRTFDAKAKGTVFGSGLGIVVVKRLDDAVADGDTIYAVIKGSAINNDGSQKVSYTAPSIEGQVGVISEALAIGGVEPETVSYIEAHGTATPLGDPIEIASLTKVFRATTDRTQYCAIGSVKSNVGHLDIAAGVTGLIKTTLALQHKELPPSLHFETANPAIDFGGSPFYVNTKLREWKTDGPRRAGVSSFGFGGTNAHVVLEEAPEPEPSGLSREWQLLILSAKTETALQAATERLAAHLQATEQELADVAYTLQRGRKAFAHRRIVVCQDGAEAADLLLSRDPKRVLTSVRPEGAGKRPVAFLFSGTGSQYVNMARDLYETEPLFHEEVNFCCERLAPLLGLDLRELLYPEEGGEEQAAVRLKRTKYAQPAIFVIEYAMAKLLQEWGIAPAAMLGHSLGEYVAACLAGVFSLEAALLLVAKRAQMIEELPTGGMLAVHLGEKELLAHLAKRGGAVGLAAVNGPALCVVSGPSQAMVQLRLELEAMEVVCKTVHTTHAFHSAMVEPMMGQFAELVGAVERHAPTVPYVSNVTGTWITAEEARDPQYWARHLREAVRFADGVQVLNQEQDVILLEVGPGKALASFALSVQPEHNPGRAVLTTIRHVQEEQSDIAFLLSALGRMWLLGAEVDWQAFSADETRRRVPLPTYPFESKRYWIEPPVQAYASDWKPTARRIRVKRTPQLNTGQPESHSLEQQSQSNAQSNSHRQPERQLQPFTFAAHPRPNVLTPYVAPGNKAERTIAMFWQELLGIEGVGVHDDFFELGGNSLLATKLTARLRGAYRVEVPLRVIFDAATVQDQTYLVEDLIIDQLEAMDDEKARSLSVSRE